MQFVRAKLWREGGVVGNSYGTVEYQPHEVRASFNCTKADNGIWNGIQLPDGNIVRFKQPRLVAVDEDTLSFVSVWYM